MRYRICDHVKISDDNGENDIYRKFKYQFDNLLNADTIPTSEKEFNDLYVVDKEFEKALSVFLSSIRNSAKFCVGYTGIGKTTSIRHYLELGVSNVTRLKTRSLRSSDKYIIIFPTFFDGAREKMIWEISDLVGRISAVCTSLEDEHPELHQIVRTSNQREFFYKFIQNHTPRILEVEDDFELVDLSREDEIKARLRYAQKEYPFEYTANKLKYYIKCKYSVYDRLVIILDDVETLPEKQQDKVIRDYLHLYDCMSNTDFPEDSEYRINLLISIRPHTLRMYKKNGFNTLYRKLEAFSIATNTVLKKRAIELDLLFKKRFDYYTAYSVKEIGNKESWKECYNELMTLNEAFEGKYKKMILNLCFMNVREALAVYSRIFANRFWVQGNRLKEVYFSVDSHQYNFNNINVIRAIGCDNSAVFTGVEDSVIPNLFFTTVNKDYSIQCLLVMQYFIVHAQEKEKSKEITYGLDAEKLSDICRCWSALVGEETKKSFYEALVHLFEVKILRKSIEDIDDIATIDTEESLDNDSKLYISPLGCELMDMLACDSVLLEMLRECAWREYDGREESYSRQSSYELLIQKEQYKIFIDLLEYIDYLREQEEKIFFEPSIEIDLFAYRQAFGETMIVSKLLHGVENSIRYSGVINMQIVSDKLERIRSRINESSGKLQEGM